MIARLLGATPEVILRHYVRPLEDDLREAVSRVPEIVVGTECPQEADIDDAAMEADQLQSSAG